MVSSAKAMALYEAVPPGSCECAQPLLLPAARASHSLKNHSGVPSASLRATCCIASLFDMSQSLCAIRLAILATFFKKLLSALCVDASAFHSTSSAEVRVRLFRFLHKHSALRSRPRTLFLRESLYKVSLAYFGFPSSRSPDPARAAIQPRARATAHAARSEPCPCL